MIIHKNYDLEKFNTFGVKALAKLFVELNNEHELEELIKRPEFKDNPKLFIGSGSNILFTKDFDGFVVLNKIKGITIDHIDDSNVYIKAYSGELWHDLVLFAVNNDFYGIENLSLIPGSVGAAPVQNIGAYGVELKDVLHSIETFNVETGEKKVFSNDECKFGYRDSIFKKELKDKYFILSIILKLKKHDKLNTDYKSLSKHIKENKINPKTSKDISEIVSSIRKSIFPETSIIGNAGSFFKNVFVDEEQLSKLLNKYPDMPYFEVKGLVCLNKIFKIPSAWLIEQCGWKGYTNDSVGVYSKHALVLINRSGASGKEIKELSDKIINSVREKFGITLESEVNVI